MLSIRNFVIQTVKYIVQLLNVDGGTLSSPTNTRVIDGGTMPTTPIERTLDGGRV